MRGRRLLAGVAFCAAVCGCGGGSGTSTEPDKGFACHGSVSDTQGDSLPLPGPPTASGVTVDICADPSIDLTDAVSKCDDKCQSELTEYANAINAANAAAGSGRMQVMTSQLTCNVNDFQPISTDCPNMDPPGVPEPPFTGGPAQDTATVSGGVHVAVDTGTPLGTVSTDTSASGQMAYSILPLNRACPPAGCDMLVTAFNISVAQFELSASFIVQLFDEKITNMTIVNVGWIHGTWTPDGHFTIPAQTASVVVTLDQNGQHTSYDRMNGSDITGTIDPVTGAVSFDSFSQTEKDTTFTVNSLAGPQVNGPPVAVITLPTTVECNQPRSAAVTLDGTASTAQNNDLHFFSWQVNGGPVLSGSKVAATLNLGSNDVLLNVFNSGLGVGIADETVNVVDTTPPVLQPAAARTDTVCNLDGQLAAVAAPPATDICDPNVSVTGQVISVNGVTLPTPIPIQNGGAQVPAGASVVQWTATDASGNKSTETQTLTVRPAFEATDEVSVELGASVIASTGFATLGNRGTNQVFVGFGAQTGSLLADGPVFLDIDSTVHGNVLAAGTIIRQPQASVTGTATAHATTVPLTAGRDLSGVTFPTSTSGLVNVLPGATVSLAPGSYSQVFVATQGTLVLTAGTYFVQNFNLAPLSKLNVDQSGGAVNLYVRDNVIDQGQMALVAGPPSSFVLGYAGILPFIVATPFPGGTIIAPNAQVSVASPGSNSFTGSLFAKDIDIEPNTIVTCAVGP